MGDFEIAQNTICIHLSKLFCPLRRRPQPSIRQFCLKFSIIYPQIMIRFSNPVKRETKHKRFSFLLASAFEIINDKTDVHLHVPNAYAYVK